MVAHRLLVLWLAFSLMPGLTPDDPRNRGDSKSDLAKESSKDNGKVETGEPLAVVTLLEAGAEPRRELRYDLKAGEEQQLLITHHYTASQRVGGLAPPPTHDPQVQAVAHACVRENDGEKIAVQLRFVDVKVADNPDAPPGGSLATAESQMRALRERTAELKVSDRGIIHSLELDRDISLRSSGLLVDPSPHLILHTLRRSIVPLPEQPVGVGARWRVVTAWKDGGIVPERETVYTITALDDDSIELAVETNAWADQQPVDVLASQRVELITYAAQESGKDVVANGALFPKEHERRTTVDMEFQVNVHAMSQKVEAASSIRPAPPVEPDAVEGDAARESAKE